MNDSPSDSPTTPKKRMVKARKEGSILFRIAVVTEHVKERKMQTTALSIAVVERMRIVMTPMNVRTRFV